MVDWSRILGRPVENAERPKRAVVRPLRARQETTASATDTADSASATDASKVSKTATAATTAEAASSATGDDTAAATESPSAPLSAGLSTDASGDVVVVTELISPPPYTATTWSAYTAHGVNATKKTTTSESFVQWPGLATTTSTHTHSSTTSAPGAWATEFGIPHNELTKCQIDGKNNTFGPFCSPFHLQNLWVGYTYAFTWNPDLFPLNATNRIQLQYADTSMGNATVSDDIAAYYGYHDIEMSEDWLQGAAGNDSTSGQNLTVILISEPAGDAPPIIHPGPAVSLVKDPATLPRIKIQHLPEKYGLEIGLPVGLAALCIIFLSICCAARRSRRGWEDMRGLGKDYMARRQRRRPHKKAGDIQLDEMDMGSGELTPRYEDQPVSGGGNVFRDEIRRQREEDDISLKRSVTSY